jgi:hypothetical protein
MIEPGHEKLSLRRQAVLLGINRNRLAVRAHPARASWEEDQKALRELDRLHTRWPFYGQRKLLVEMRRAGVVINRKRLWRSLKCELIYLSSYDNLHELEAAITRWMNDYNHHRIHQTLGYTTPWENYRPAEGLATAA